MGQSEALRGRCTCGAVVFEMRARPMIVHACHCTWCQRETGTAFAWNAVVEADRVVVRQGAPEAVTIPSASGKGQEITRCPDCRVALWSVYAGAGPAIRFVRVGTLENPGACPPDIHIFTSTRQPFIDIPEGVRVVPEYYRRSEVWTPENIARREAALART